LLIVFFGYLVVVGVVDFGLVDILQRWVFLVGFFKLAKDVLEVLSVNGVILSGYKIINI
jgi:hypothetical protein